MTAPVASQPRSRQQLQTATLAPMIRVYATPECGVLAITLGKKTAPHPPTVFLGIHPTRWSVAGLEPFDDALSKWPRTIIDKFKLQHNPQNCGIVVLEQRPDGKFDLAKQPLGLRLAAPQIVDWRVSQ